MCCDRMAVDGLYPTSGSDPLLLLPDDEPLPDELPFPGFMLCTFLRCVTLRALGSAGVGRSPSWVGRMDRQ